MTKIVRHVALPALAPIAFFAAASTPVDVLGCRNRGLLALTIALVGALAGLGTALFALRGRLRGEGGELLVGREHAPPGAARRGRGRSVAVTPPSNRVAGYPHSDASRTGLGDIARLNGFC